MLIRTHLVVSSEQAAQQIKKSIAGSGVIVFSVDPAENTYERISHESSDLVIIDRAVIPNPAVDFIRTVRELPEHPDIIVLIDREDPEERARLLSWGCMAALNITLPASALETTLKSLLKRRVEGVRPNLYLTRQPQQYSLGDFFSASPGMQQFLKTVERVVAADSSLLILGETGVGKERLARAIHFESPRAKHAFIPVDCAALPETLLESELFGHTKGAFTGAINSRRGFFELAHRGTIFLDEIGELSQYVQVKLLRVLQERVIQRIGGETPIEVDVRVMAATNRDLAVEAETNRFRKDLYYRLGVVTLTVPPLRERREDIPYLAAHYLQQFRARLRREVNALTDQAMEALIAYPWPGNVRELINVMERSVLLSNGQSITLEDLPQVITHHHFKSLPPVQQGTADHSWDQFFKQTWLEQPWEEVRRNALAAVEVQYLKGLLMKTKGRIGQAAALAGITPRSLYDKMQKYALHKEVFR